MQFRRFGIIQPSVSALGFGCMRLPTKDGDPLSPQICEAEAIRMIRAAVDSGVNYFDTAYPYHAGNSETVLGKALRDGYRNKVRIATKSPVWFIQQRDDFDRYLNEQLHRLGTDCIDCYLFHGLDRRRWESQVLGLELLEKAESAVHDGRIRYVGFSFHDSFDAFQQILNGYDGWDFCQIQYNYMDTENQAGAQGLKLAAAKGLGVVVMEPLLGGRLSNPPERVAAVFAGHRKQRSPSEWALQWLWSQPEVSVVLSGMSTLAQVESNLRAAAESGIGILEPDDLEMIGHVREKYRETTPIPCTRCGYCMPCPNGVNIPRNFELHNDGFIYSNPTASRMFYTRFMPKGERADGCVQCQECMDKCPQKIPIPKWMEEVHNVLGEGRPYAR